MTVSNGQVLKVFLELVLEDGSIVQNVYYLISSFLEEQGDNLVAAAVETYLEDIMGEISTYLSADFTINPSHLHEMSWDIGASKWVTTRLVDIFVPSFIHTNTDDQFPNQIAAVMLGDTVRPKTRGRKFLPGLVETAAEGSYLITAAVVALVGAASKYISLPEVATDNYLFPGVPRVGVDDFKTFMSAQANTILGTQRRRTPGVGS